VPPEPWVVPRFAAEPPHELLPYGRWAATLGEEFLAACLRLSGDEGQDLGEPADVVWFPDRTWHGRTYVPATTLTSTGFELFGHVSFTTAEDGRSPSDFEATADFTEETAAENPDWQLDLSDEVVGRWHGEHGVAAMTLVWGVALVTGGALATAELGDVTVDQCALVEERFTLLAPDDYRGDLLEVRLYDKRGGQLAAESLYEEEE
jgi:hypothetical protein